jgi:hypothetical protein
VLVEGGLRQREDEDQALLDRGYHAAAISGVVCR